MPSEAPRIALYGIGQYGKLAVKYALERGWSIVAAYNRAGPKVGQDVGRLAGLDRDLGVIVEDCDNADYATSGANIGIVMLYDRLEQNIVAHERLLGAGMNVICHGTESYYPQVSSPPHAKRIDALARSRGLTFTGTGVWDMSRVWSALLIAGPCQGIKALHNGGYTNMAPFGEPSMSWGGVGMTPEDFYTKVAAKGSVFQGLYRTYLYLVANALGFTPAKYTERQEPVIFDKPFYCVEVDREYAAGLCAGMVVKVRLDTEEGVPLTGDIESRLLFREGEYEHQRWDINGEPWSPKIIVNRDNGHLLHILSVLGRVKDVIAAPPGIRLLTELGPIQYGKW